MRQSPRALASQPCFVYVYMQTRAHTDRFIILSAWIRERDRLDSKLLLSFGTHTRVAYT